MGLWSVNVLDQWNILNYFDALWPLSVDVLLVVVGNVHALILK